MSVHELMTPDDEERLRSQMAKEFEMSDTHTSNWKSSVENVGRDFLFPEPKQDKVKVRKVWNNLKIRKSIFLADDLQVTNVPMNWVLWQSIASNWDKVLKANYKSMDIRDKYEEVLVDDAMQWVGVLTVDWWNDHDQEPIVSYVDSRLTFPDPKNWKWNKMRFFGTLLRKSVFELEADTAYDQNRIQQVKLQKSQELDEIDRANNRIKWFTDTDVWEWLVDMYNHITIFKSSKDKEHHLYLTSWWVDRATLTRVVKMRALTATEKADPSKITLGVQLFRANPIKWSYAGASLIDEIGQYQDLETLLTNLQISQAIEAWLWGKTFVDSSLWIDTDDLASITWPAVIPYTSKDPSKNASNSIILEQPRVNNPAVQNGLVMLQTLSQEWSSTWSALVQWQSLWGTQTKAEVQTLQQNINQGISLMASNYMESLIGLWWDVMRSYSVNMSPQRKKIIVTIDDNDKTDSYWFKKNEFVSKWNVYITIRSKAQEDIKKQQDFAVLLSVIWTLKQSVKPWSTQDVIIDRMFIEKAGIKWLSGKDIHPFTKDERIAYDNLDMLNNDIELKSKPSSWEDHNVYINIYKTGLETDARNKAISIRELALEQEPPVAPAEEELWGWWVAQQLWASLISQQSAQWDIPSIQNVSA